MMNDKTPKANKLRFMHDDLGLRNIIGRVYSTLRYIAVQHILWECIFTECITLHISYTHTLSAHFFSCSRRGSFKINRKSKISAIRWIWWSSFVSFLQHTILLAADQRFSVAFLLLCLSLSRLFTVPRPNPFLINYKFEYLVVCLHHVTKSSVCCRTEETQRERRTLRTTSEDVVGANWSTSNGTISKKFASNNGYRCLVLTPTSMGIVFSTHTMTVRPLP